MCLGASQVLERHSVVAAAVHIKLATILREMALGLVGIAHQLVQRLGRTLAAN